MNINAASVANAAANVYAQVSPSLAPDASATAGADSTPKTGNPALEIGGPSPKPVVNADGQTTGTRINVTA